MRLESIEVDKIKEYLKDIFQDVGMIILHYRKI